MMGTSMGCMHAWVWGEIYADFMDALMPLACVPVQIAGRNRMWREMIMDAIRNDPAWKNGEYKTEPQEALTTSRRYTRSWPASAPLQCRRIPDARCGRQISRGPHEGHDCDGLDANDLLYQVNASRNYDPSAALRKISARVMWVNSADDFINPPELGIAESEVRKLKNGRFVLIPIYEQTHGHGTHTYATVWQQYLKELLEESKH